MGSEYNIEILEKKKMTAPRREFKNAEKLPSKANDGVWWWTIIQYDRQSSAAAVQITWIGGWWGARAIWAIGEAVADGEVIGLAVKGTHLFMRVSRRIITNAVFWPTIHLKRMETSYRREECDGAPTLAAHSIRSRAKREEDEEEEEDYHHSLRLYSTPRGAEWRLTWWHPRSFPDDSSCSLTKCERRNSMTRVRKVTTVRSSLESGDRLTDGWK